MLDQTLEFFSGFPVILSPNAPAKLKYAKLDGRPIDVFKDKRGRIVQVANLDRNYHLYILASRTFSTFGTRAEWDRRRLAASATLCFHTYPAPTEIDVTLVFDGTSPYPIPTLLRPSEVHSVAVKPAEQGGFPLGMTFTHDDGSSVSCLLSPDLLHFIRLPHGHREITDFNVEYVGIACGPNGDRSVFDRARAHEKVVEIQGDFQQRFGNRSLFIFAYDPGYLISANFQGPVIFTGQELINRLVDGGMNSLYEAMEASLIAYFKPEYNSEFKNFPMKRPNWLTGKFGSLDGPVMRVDTIKVTLASDSSFNPDGVWSFGRFRSPVCPPRELHFVAHEGLKKT